MSRLFNDILMSPDESGGNTGVQTPELTADDILNELNKSDEKPRNGTELPDPDENEDDTNDEDSDSSDNEKEDSEKESKEEEIDELKEIEEELKTPSEEDLELKTPVQRRALMKDYPEIFKKHPGLESTIYRERAYTELLPTINDAKEALKAVQILDSFEADLKEGKTTDLLKSIQAEDPNGFAKLVDNYLDNLGEVNPQARLHVIGNITKDIVTAMMTFGREKGDEAVQDAASTLYQFMFNSTKWEGKKKLAADTVVDESVANERAKLEKERKEFEQGKLSEATSKLMTSIDNQVKGTIEKTIDPKSEMGNFVKSKAIDEVLTKAHNLLKKDTRFQQIVQQLTTKAGKEKFSDESLNRIKSAYFTKYKAILLPIVKAVKQEALKGTKDRIKSQDTEVNDTTERANRDKPQSRNSGNNDNSKPLPGESSLDFLMRRKK